jgi:amino acid permease
MPRARTLLRYFASLTTGRIILWCYLIWYLVTVVNHFDASLALWLSSIGVSAIIGFALLLSVNDGGSLNRDSWQTFRLFLMPFCVSSFSSLIKNQGYILIVPPRASEQLEIVALCGAFVLAVVALKRRRLTAGA